MKNWQHDEQTYSILGINPAPCYVRSLVLPSYEICSGSSVRYTIGFSTKLVWMLAITEILVSLSIKKRS